MATGQAPLSGEPSTLDRWSAASHNFSNGPGLGAGIVDAIKGAQTGERTDRVGMQQQRAAIIVNALWPVMAIWRNNGK